MAQSDVSEAAVVVSLDILIMERTGWWPRQIGAWHFTASMHAGGASECAGLDLPTAR